MRTFLPGFGGSLALLLVFAASAIAAPDNDNLAQAMPFGPPQQTTLDNSDATVQPGEPLTGATSPICPPNLRMSSTTWYRVNGTGGPLTILTQRASGSWFLGLVAVYQTSGSDPSTIGSPVACGLEKVTFASQAGVSYLVQVGSSLCQNPNPDRCDEQNWHRGTHTVWSVIAPANDARANALAVNAGALTTIGDSRGATTEPGETLTCPVPPDLRAINKTVWFRYDAPAVGTASFSASGFAEPSIAVYRQGEASPRKCLKAPWSGTAVQLSLDVEPGAYLIQVGAVNGPGGRIDFQPQFTPDLDVDGDGSNVPSDCNDANPGVRPGAVDIPDNGIDEDCAQGDAVDLDRDRDTFLRPQDCDDGNPSIHPGAVDTPDNGVDEDCSQVDSVDLDRDGDGVLRPQDCRDDVVDVFPGALDTPGDGIDQDCDSADAPFPVLPSRLGAFFNMFRDHTRFTDLYIVNARAGSVWTIRCRGRGCPFKERKREIQRDAQRLSLMARVSKTRFRRGVVLTVTVAKSGSVGVVTRWKFRPPASPKRSDLCLPPGARRPTKCV